MNNKYLQIINMANNIIAPGNRCTVSSVIEKGILKTIVNKYGDDWKSEKGKFISAYKSLTIDGFNVKSYKEDVPYLYSMYYLLMNIPKVQLVLLEIMKENKLKNELRILDVGSSVGTSTFAIIDLIAILDNICSLLGQEPIFKNIIIDSVEGSKDNIKVFKENLNFVRSEMRENIDIGKIIINEPLNIDISDIHGLSNTYDIIIISNVLNEIEYDQRKDLVNELIDKLNIDGKIAIIEPANKENAVALNNLKVDVVDDNKVFNLGPCGCSEACRSCWIFRSEHAMYGKLMKYINSIRKTTGRINYNGDLFYEERIKWIYTILGKQKSKKIENNKYVENQRSSADFYVVSGRKKSSYNLCDGISLEKFNLVFDGVPVRKLTFGNTIRFDNVEIKVKERNVTIDCQTSLQVFPKNYQNEKVKVENVTEKATAFVLKRFWGFDKFRDGQFDIIKSALKDKDTLGILPTGAGKSLCFQVPSMIKTGVSIVITPLKSLMKDQIDNLRKAGFENIAYINGSQTNDEMFKTLNRFKGGYIKILYIAPERLQMIKFQEQLVNLLENFCVDYFIIDESHCASEWGHDFRPAYMRILQYATKIHRPTIVALTATASKRVRDDIMKIFNIKNENVIMGKTLDRPEISFEVVKVNSVDDKIPELNRLLTENIPNYLNYKSIKELSNNSSGIIFEPYTGKIVADSTPEHSVEGVYSELQKMPLSVGRYHSGLTDKENLKTQDEFKSNKIKLLVATKGFGMGIDKPNISYVVHMSACGSLEGYYQEAGRAGRDGEHAHSVIISTPRLAPCINDNRGLEVDEPGCVSSWSCRINKGKKCDYGVQAGFIFSNYPGRETNRSYLDFFINRFIRNIHNQNTFNLTLNGPSSDQEQKYLYYMQQLNYIKDFNVITYTKASNGLTPIMKIELIEGFNKNEIEVNRNNFIEFVLNKFEQYKKQKYEMLSNMYSYVNNTTVCRRQFLMNYFGDEASYGIGGCGFCDIEGYSEERAVSVTASLRVKRLYANLSIILDNDKFSYEKVYLIKEVAYKENLEENIKIRAMKLLEDFPDRNSALYLSGMISIKTDRNDETGIRRITNCLKHLIEEKELSSVYLILQEVVDINADLTFDFIEEHKLNYKAELADKLFSKLDDEHKKERVYKAFFNDRLTFFNKEISAKMSALTKKKSTSLRKNKTK